METVIATSKKKFENMCRIDRVDDSNVEEVYSHMALISIVCSSEFNYFSHDHPNVINLKFDDITSKTTGLLLFSKDDASKIIEFIDRNVDKLCVVVHCSAGISRSGAVATYIAERFNLSKCHIAHCIPNTFILHKLSTHNQGD